MEQLFLGGRTGLSAARSSGPRCLVVVTFRGWGRLLSGVLGHLLALQNTDFQSEGVALGLGDG